MHAHGLQMKSGLVLGCQLACITDKLDLEQFEDCGSLLDSSKSVRHNTRSEWQEHF